MTARRLLRRRGLPLARTASFRAVRKVGAAKGPKRPFQRCSVLQLASLRFTVLGRMRVGGSQKALVDQRLHDLGRHAMRRIDFALRRVPEMMGQKLQRQRFWRRPGQGGAGRHHRPGLEIAEIRGKRAQRILAHALAGEML